jgi:hypothetical protein
VFEWTLATKVRIYLCVVAQTRLRVRIILIVLQGLPCGQVVSVKQQGDNDYIASCADGNRYHVFVNAAGRVVAQKQ